MSLQGKNRTHHHKILVGAPTEIIGQWPDRAWPQNFLASHPMPSRLDPAQFKLALITIVQKAADAMASGGRSLSLFGDTHPKARQTDGGLANAWNSWSTTLARACRRTWRRSRPSPFSRQSRTAQVSVSPQSRDVSSNPVDMGH